MTLYNVVFVNEGADILSIKHFLNKDDAMSFLAEELENDKKMLKNEGWDESSLEINETPFSYTIYYSEYFYHGQIVKTEL